MMYNYASTSGIMGKALLARPDAADPNLERAVVYMLAHSPAGAMGIVLNRPTQVDASDLVSPLADWIAITPEPRVLFSGGPVETDGIIGIVADAQNKDTGVSSITRTTRQRTEQKRLVRG
ncbi:MAG: YqgE/AlgH family protein [Actinobacteria bacterium]|nr:YqgE/AlgH family protein [Actinomycetota bacterium]